MANRNRRTLKVSRVLTVPQAMLLIADHHKLGTGDAVRLEILDRAKPRQQVIPIRLEPIMREEAMLSRLEAVAFPSD